MNIDITVSLRGFYIGLYKSKGYFNFTVALGAFVIDVDISR